MTFDLGRPTLRTVDLSRCDCGMAERAPGWVDRQADVTNEKRTCSLEPLASVHLRMSPVLISTFASISRTSSDVGTQIRCPAARCRIGVGLEAVRGRACSERTIAQVVRAVVLRQYRGARHGEDQHRVVDGNRRSTDRRLAAALLAVTDRLGQPPFHHSLISPWP